MIDTPPPLLSENVLNTLLLQFCTAINDDETIAAQAKIVRDQLIASQLQLQKKAAAAEKKFSLTVNAIHKLQPYVDENNSEIPSATNQKKQAVVDAYQQPDFIHGIIDKLAQTASDVSESITGVIDSASELRSDQISHNLSAGLFACVEGIVSQSTTGSAIVKFSQQIEQLNEDKNFFEDRLKRLCSTDWLKNIFSEITEKDKQAKSISDRGAAVLSGVADTVSNYGTSITIAKVVGIGGAGVAATASGVVVVAILASVVYGSYHAIKHFENNLVAP
jgi:hypothetical protein